MTFQFLKEKKGQEVETKRNETSHPLILFIVLGDEGERGVILVREKVRGAGLTQV